MYIIIIIIIIIIMLLFITIIVLCREEDIEGDVICNPTTVEDDPETKVNN